MKVIRATGIYVTFLLGSFLSLTGEADQVPDEWRNMHCPNAVPEGNVIQTPYLGKIQDYGIRGDEGKRDAFLAQANRYRLCSMFVYSDSSIPISAYRAKEILLESGGHPDSIRRNSLDAILEQLEERIGDSETFNKVVADMYRTAYTEEYAHMDGREATRKLTETYFCECLNIPAEEFEDL